MTDTFAHIDWTKSNAELAIDLKVVAKRDWFGPFHMFEAHSELADDPEFGLVAYAPTREDAIDEIVCILIDRYAPVSP